MSTRLLRSYYERKKKIKTSTMYGVMNGEELKPIIDSEYHENDPIKFKWTRENYIEYFNQFEESWIKNNPRSSKPTFLFKINHKICELVFDYNNWNGCDLIRSYLLYLYYEGELPEGVFLIEYEDTTHIIIHGYSDMESGGYGEFSVMIRWYKSRGRTELITFNDHPIMLGEYIMLLNYLEIPLHYEKNF